MSRRKAAPLAPDGARRAERRSPRRTPRTTPRRAPRVRPRPLGPHPVERGSVRIPIRDHAGGFTIVKLTPADYALGMRYPWRLDSDGYVIGYVFDRALGKSVRLALHRLVARTPTGVLCDHIFGRKTDCRRRALRHATHSQNTANRRDDRSGRSSKYRGVTRHRRSGKWQAQCKHANVNAYLGLFATEVDAARAYNAKARAVWGRFAHLNRVTATAGRAA